MDKLTSENLPKSVFGPFEKRLLHPAVSTGSIDLKYQLGDEKQKKDLFRLYRTLRKDAGLDSVQVKNLLQQFRFGEDKTNSRGTYGTWASGRSEVLPVNGGIVNKVSPSLFKDLQSKYSLTADTNMMIVLKGTGPRGEFVSPNELPSIFNSSHKHSFNGFTALDANDFKMTWDAPGEYQVYDSDNNTTSFKYIPSRAIIGIIPIKEIHAENKRSGEVNSRDMTQLEEPLVVEVMWERGGFNLQDLKTFSFESTNKKHDFSEYLKLVTSTDPFFSDIDTTASVEKIMERLIMKHWYDSQVESIWYQNMGGNRTLQNMTLMGWKDLDDIQISDNVKHTSDNINLDSARDFFKQKCMWLKLIFGMYDYSPTIIDQIEAKILKP